jgi:hypothetical protein
MSATMPAPAPIHAPTDTAAQPAPQRVVALPPRPGTDRAEPVTRASQSSRFAGQLGDAVFFTAWATVLTVAGVVAASALAIATPYVVGRALYDERKYR